VVPPTLTTSTRLVRAVTAERTELARHRERLFAAKANVREELDRIEASLADVEDRDALLARLVGRQTGPESAAREGVVAEARPAGVPAERLLRGPAIRRAAVQVLLDQPGRPEALHYRDWYERLMAAGYAVVGKDPLAVFLTQISRSAVITGGTKTGVYSLDPQAPRRLRQRLDELTPSWARCPPPTTPPATWQPSALAASS
jgi:hypothetical protein